MTLSLRSFCSGFLKDTVMFVTFSIARGEPNSNGGGGTRKIHFLSSQQLPSQVIHIKKQQRFAVFASKFLEHTRLPAVGEIRLGIHIFGEESILVRDALEVQNFSNQVQMGDQNSLRQIFGKIFVAGRNALPELRNS